MAAAAVWPAVAAFLLAIAELAEAEADVAVFATTFRPVADVVLPAEHAPDWRATLTAVALAAEATGATPTWARAPTDLSAVAVAAAAALPVSFATRTAVALGATAAEHTAPCGATLTCVACEDGALLDVPPCARPTTAAPETGGRRRM